jgi:hypothetical protein
VVESRSIHPTFGTESSPKRSDSDTMPAKSPAAIWKASARPRVGSMRRFARPTLRSRGAR